MLLMILESERLWKWESPEEDLKVKFGALKNTALFLY